MIIETKSSYSFYAVLAGLSPNYDLRPSGALEMPKSGSETY
jgi:hypothetical protein